METCGFPCGSDIKERSRNAEYLCSIPGLGRPLGGGNGNPFQYSSLENPMDRGAWRGIVQNVAQSQTQLKWLSMHGNMCLLWKKWPCHIKRSFLNLPTIQLITPNFLYIKFLELSWPLTMSISMHAQLFLTATKVQPISTFSSRTTSNVAFSEKSFLILHPK